MHTYVLVSFWLTILTVIVNVAALAAHTREGDTVKIIGSLLNICCAVGFACWSGVLLYG
jgi:hypothetical protein